MWQSRHPLPAYVTRLHDIHACPTSCSTTPAVVLKKVELCLLCYTPTHRGTQESRALSITLHFVFNCDCYWVTYVVLVGADSVYVSDVVYRSEDSVFTVLVGGLERLCVVYQSEDSVFTKIIFFLISEL